MELLELIFRSGWTLVGAIILWGMLIKTIVVLAALITKTPLTDGYSKQDLSEAWHHGAVRTPKEYEHVNNFDTYYYFKYESGKNHDI